MLFKGSKIIKYSHDPPIEELRYLLRFDITGVLSNLRRFCGLTDTLYNPKSPGYS